MTDGSHSMHGMQTQTDDRSLSQLLAEMTSELSTLMRKEVELAKAETKEEVGKASKAAAMFGGTAVTGFMALLLISFAAAWGLAEIIEPGWAFLVVGLIYAVVAAVLLSQGKKKMQQVNPVPENTVETLKEDVEWAKARKN